MTGKRTRVIHRFEVDGRYFVIDPETCFCLECDDVSWAVFEHYPDASFEETVCRLEGRFPRREIEEVISEIEWLRAGGSLWPKITAELLARRYESPAVGLREVTVVLSSKENPAAEASSQNELSPFREGWFANWRHRSATGPPEKTNRNSDAGQEHIRNLLLSAGQLLLGRSGNSQTLRLMLSLPAEVNPLTVWQETESIAALLWRNARLAEKTLTVGFVQPGDPAESPGAAVWRWSVESDTGPESITRALHARPRRFAPGPVAAWLESVESDSEEIRGTVILTPVNPDFDGLVRYWRKTGFRRIILRDAPLAASLAPDALERYLRSMRRNAEDYAADLLKSDLYLCEPFAAWFRLIYNGEPAWRGDPAGAACIAVSADGAIFPDEDFQAGDVCRLGHIGSDRQPTEWHTDTAASFADLGGLTMPSCLNCWARGLCGGGSALVHCRRTGSVNRPDPAWCDVRRRTLEYVIAAFNTLSAAGIPFNDLHRALGRRKPQLSWRMLIRAARGGVLAVRPIRETDAPLLTRWERWNPAVYFSLTDSGVLMTTCHDRENDALHPKPWLMELALVRPGKDRPVGLLRLMPHRLPETLWAWLYLRDPADYRHAGVRQGLRDLLDSTLKDRAVRRMLIPVGPWDTGLAACLEAIGFSGAGVLREALFLHGGYHDVIVFSWDTGREASA